MSLNALRYQKRIIRERSKRSEKIARRRGIVPLRNLSDQQLAVYLLQPEIVKNIFGCYSVYRAWRVALRVARLKGRDRTQKGCRTLALQGRLSGRNRHHLTPQCREDAPFHGGMPSVNILLMRIRRHNFLHGVFGVRTWEEIVIVLACAKKLDDHEMLLALFAHERERAKEKRKNGKPNRRRCSPRKRFEVLDVVGPE